MSIPSATEPFAFHSQPFLLLAFLLMIPLGCSSVPKNDVADVMMPSNYRDWSPEFSVVPTVEIQGDDVTVHQVRNSSYVTEEDYVLRFEDRTYDLSELETVDFFFVPFAKMPMMAHTMLSFGFKGDRYLAISSEIRTEKGETYSPVLGISRQYELTYVVADERDLIRLRTQYRDADVYLYRTVATPELARKLFKSMAMRLNELAESPEFYDTLRNNCTTNLVQHVNEIAPRRVPYTLGVLLPGYADQYAYDLGLLDRTAPFSRLKQQAWINDLAERYFDDPDFSKKIRMRVAAPDWNLQPVNVSESEVSSDSTTPSDALETTSPQPAIEDGWVQRTGFSTRLPSARQRQTGGRKVQASTPPLIKPTRQPPLSPPWFDLDRWSRRTRTPVPVK